MNTQIFIASKCYFTNLKIKRKKIKLQQRGDGYVWLLIVFFCFFLFLVFGFAFVLLLLLLMMFFLQPKLAIGQIYYKSITIFNELNGCSQNYFADVIFKLTITIKNDLKWFSDCSNRIINLIQFIHKSYMEADMILAW